MTTPATVEPTAIPPADHSGYRGLPVRLEAFEGPLDLLLHLIKRDQIEIWEIEISRITQQYLTTIATWQVLEIEVAGEFLVMAASLMRMKSQSLLPRPSFLPLADEDDPPLTREQLVARLVEYRRVREAARTLRQRELDEGRRFVRGSTAQLDPDFQLPLREPKLLDLLRSFEDVLHRRDAVPPGHQVQLEAFRLEEQMDWIRERVQDPTEWEAIPGGEGLGLRFSRLLRHAESANVSRTEVVVTLLGVLELSRLQQLRSWQERALAEVWLSAREGGTPIEVDGAGAIAGLVADRDPGKDREGLRGSPGTREP